MKEILLVEDEEQFARFIELELRHEGFSVSCAFDGESGLRLATSKQWSLILLDVMLPGIDGVDLCRMIRMTSQTPVIMITARDAITDRIRGLGSGADDYIPKPFAIGELLARMRAIFRRIERAEPDAAVLTYRDITLNEDTMTVRIGERKAELTKREFDIFKMFMRHPGEALSRDRILDEIWGANDQVEANIVDVYIRHIRLKLQHAGKTDCIHTVWGVGYCLQ
ncbi:PhoB family transcriptional regulator [Gordoniibacillus kamchatkensis]|uniref:PhoB family transcriptional regulator n=1 Tax=Gordoniibacillus kamchatkensis TaxID=1590651 RepID=A0ABR5AI60_9BACL|nr:response regulator transcription factor [Paenibacillus sp. VKM B-2647]KIL40711.1 PhoB family transcriptional regulator [Paenibacillus sp. VKM B-2647]